ncbi:MAG: NPCBM/NEW2 domain-containing protein, partial [Culicoidibacterales bacterium]
DVMRAKDPQQYLQVNLVGAKELKLIVNNSGNGNGSDHGTFGDTKLHYVNEARADITKLQALIMELDALNFADYTQASVDELQLQLTAAKALIARGDAMQTEVDTMHEMLVQAREQLVLRDITVNIPDAVLKRKIIETLGLTSETIMNTDLARLVALNLEFEYVRDLTGLEYAINLESLNLNYTEVTDLRPLQKLTKLTDLQVNESFQDLGQATYVDGFFILEPIAVFDKDGQVLEPSEFVLSSGVETMTLPVESVYVDGVIKIDARLLGGQNLKTIEIKYASDVNAFSAYTFHWLQLPTDVEANPIVTIPDETLRTSVLQALQLESEQLRASDLLNLKQLNLETSYVRDLTGLEYAINLEALNVNYAEVTDLRPLRNLPKLVALQAEENFLDQGDALFDGQTFIIEPIAVFDQNGQKLEPLQIVVTTGNEVLTLPIDEVTVDNKLQIDVSLVGEKKISSAEIMYASTNTSFSVFTFHWLKK